MMEPQESPQEVLAQAQAPIEVPGLEDDRLITIAEQAERRIDAVKRIKGLVLRVTNSADWVNQGGKPYLQGSGGEKVARLFGISWRLGPPKEVRDPDGHVTFSYVGRFSLGMAEIDALGMRSSRDPFFAKAGDEVIDPRLIDLTDVQKAAYTNCIANGVTRLLGIRNMTWEELKDAGITQEQVATVTYKKKVMPPPPPQPVPLVLPNYGTGANVPLQQATDEQLDFYLKGVRKALAENKKPQYRTKNENLVRAIEEELDRRRQPPTVGDEPPEEMF